MNLKIHRLYLVAGRRIVGATLRTRDLDALQDLLATTPWSVSEVVQTANGRSMFIPPDIAHGLWLEFREGES